MQKHRSYTARRVSFMRSTVPAAYTSVPVTIAGITGHVPGISPVTFIGMSVTIPESAVTLDRNTHRVNARAVLEAMTAAERPVTVRTGTIHSAKGREWQYVFVVGLADGQLPLYLLRHDATMLAEERRMPHDLIVNLLAK